MEFLALIPARFASTRFPGKPLADIGGKPMIQHVYERVTCVFGAHSYVATDDDRIAEAVVGFGGRYIMTGGQHGSGTERCAEAMDIAEALTGKKFGVVVNVQGDEPFIDQAHLDALKSLFNDADTQIGTLVRRFREGEDISDVNSPKVVLSRDGFAMYFSRLPIPYVRDKAGIDLVAVPYYKHIGLYAYRSAVLREIAGLPCGTLEKAESLEQLRWIENGFRIKTAEVTGETLAVDTPGDLERVKDFYINQR